MRRILSFILLTFLFLSVQGQISRYPFYQIGSVGTATFILTYTGNGTGVTTIQFYVSDTTNMALDGNGYFYTDASGTLNKSQSWELYSGSLQTRYIRLESGTSNLVIDNPDNVIGWGYRSGSTPYIGYSAANNAPMIIGGSIEQFSPEVLQYLFIGTGGNYNENGISGSLTGFTLLNTLRLGGGKMTGDISNMTALEYIYINSSYSSITGDFGINNVCDGISVSFLLGTGCKITDYTIGGTWENVNITINPDTGYGLSSTEIDNMLIDMAASQTLSGRTITLQGSNAGRTSASDDAVAILTTLNSGYTHAVNTVITN